MIIFVIASWVVICLAECMKRCIRRYEPIFIDLAFIGFILTCAFIVGLVSEAFWKGVYINSELTP